MKAWHHLWHSLGATENQIQCSGPYELMSLTLLCSKWKISSALLINGADDSSSSINDHTCVLLCFIIKPILGNRYVQFCHWHTHESPWSSTHILFYSSVFVSPPLLSRGQGEPQSRVTFVDSDASSWKLGGPWLTSKRKIDWKQRIGTFIVKDESISLSVVMVHELRQCPVEGARLSWPHCNNSQYTATHCNTLELRAARIFPIARVYPSFSTGSEGSRSNPVLVRSFPCCFSRCPDDPIPILLNRNRNPYRGFQFQQSLAWDHIPRSLVWDSKRSSLVNWHLIVFTRYSLIATVSRAATGRAQYQKRSVHLVFRPQDARNMVVHERSDCLLLNIAW